MHGQPFVIAKAGKPLVKVCRLDAADETPRQRLGFLAGQIEVPDDFDRMGASPFSLWGFIDFGADSTATTRVGAANEGGTAMKPPHNARIKPMQLITVLMRIVTFLSLELTESTQPPASDSDAKRCPL